MKLAQYYDQGTIRTGIIRGNHVLPTEFRGDMISLIQCGQTPVPGGTPVPLARVRLGPPVSHPSKIIAIGLNYRDHAKESNGKIPEVPLVFAKFPNSIVGPGDEIVWDVNITNKVDFEAELAVIIGKTVRDCTKDQAREAVFGYTCANDVSARDLQFGDGQWVRGKSLDTFCPLGPWIVTPEEIPDPHCLSIRCLLNGKLMQDSNTSRIVFRVPDLIRFFSRHFTLKPGDVILTGTPHGVGTFRDPSVYMKNGDEIIVEIEGIGRLVNRCRTKID
ncbi:MAG: hypothetical protein B5M55_04200 [Desulfococcus sp. 4484_242]|nr:MAG: hypothetical protein B5M55_04200 [Desulfococcus sp. 4484_242]